MKSKLKKLILIFLVTICILSLTVIAFTQDNMNLEDNEKIEVMVTVNTNMWKDKDGYYSENKELIIIIPINTVIYVQDTPKDSNYALCKYKNASENDIFGYVSKDNIKLFYY